MDAPAGSSASGSPDSVTFTDLVDLGDRSDGDVSVHGYRFFVREQGQYHGPVEVDIARSTGLPTRFAMSEPSMGASMVMHYSDYDRPAEIEMPPCLSK
jgi:predicted RNA-binding protein with TRAM domain